MADELDRYLESYSRVEPPVALERRVMERCAQPRVKWWAWAAALPAFASVWFVFAPQPVVVAPPVAPRIQASAPPLVKASRVQQVRRVVVRRPAVFPTPSPITAEERAVLQLAAMHPEALRPIERTELKPIEIAPLSDSGRMEE